MAKNRQNSFRPHLEILEGRLAPAVYTVNTLADGAEKGSGRKGVGSHFFWPKLSEFSS